ncbi:MAG: polysaccharide pyruvyl transferase family protein [Bryobacteraceae bacterium]|nr:polysaccharide pyruvyl transferase family protein [Bryobacteraceae bacterium]
MSIPTSRRGFLASCATLKAVRRPKILLRSSWQSVNIGDIGHTPGALSLLGKYFPEAEITLWPGRLGHGSRDLLTRGYPELKIVEGALDKDGKPATPELARAWAEADLYLSGSGSGFPASNHAAAFAKATGKPVGVFGVSADPVSGFGPGRQPEGGTLDELRAKALALPPTHLPPALRFIIGRAAFFFCRDTISLEYLKAQQVRTPVLEFGPDAQLGMHLRDDVKAFAYLRACGLEDKRFICVVPRLRYTPYYRIDGRARVPDDDVKDAINARTTAQDHAKLRDLIAAYVRGAGCKVLAVPEMTYQIELARQQLVDPLPPEIRKNVVWRDTFWLPDEAASVYSKAQAVISLECHSPLIAYRSGTPAFYLRQPTDTCKGQMYRDFGAAAWLFEIDQTSGAELWSRLQPIVKDPSHGAAVVGAIMSRVESLQKRMVGAVRAACVTLPG